MNTKTCSKCGITKLFDNFLKNTNICKDCNNLKRRLKYKTDQEYRKKSIENAIYFKKKKQNLVREQKENEIGINNKKCKHCNIIKDKSLFRHNRLKCRNCERDDPVDKFKRYVRTRIYNCLLRNKNKNTIVYLGCNTDAYLKWITSYSESFTLKNYGKIWHIDHVIPISKFNLKNEEEQLLAFNWRNTMPLLAKENLSKNCKILRPQIEQHLQKLVDYHKKQNLVMPQNFSDLFARYLDAGNPLELSLPPINGNISGELG